MSGLEGHGRGRGAYGLRLNGLDSDALGEAPASWPPATVTRAVDEGPKPAPVVAEARAVMDLGGGWLELDRPSRSIAFRARRALTDDEIVHPFLTPAAAVFAHWDGRIAFHAGAFLHGGGAWLVFGGNEAGKSSLLAALALRGLPVVADDLSVVSPGRVLFAGPRSVDLRDPGPLGASDQVTLVRTATRHRLALEPVAPEHEVRGFFALAWGDGPLVEPLPTQARLARLARRPPWPADPRRILDLTGLPGWRLTRPRAWPALEASIDALLATAI